jgi:magnesium-transporting ATPase (P-type)
MKNFNWTRFLIAVVAVFVSFQFLDWLIHSVILMPKYEALDGTGLFREDMESMMWIMFITAAVFSIFFVYLFHFFTNGYKTGWMAGLYYGLVVGFLMNVIGMFNQYAVYPVPLDLTWQWLIYNIIEIALIGLVAGLIYKPKAG